jgi:hypothetical protein
MNLDVGIGVYKPIPARISEAATFDPTPPAPVIPTDEVFRRPVRPGGLSRKGLVSTSVIFNSKQSFPNVPEFFPEGCFRPLQFVAFMRIFLCIFHCEQIHLHLLAQSQGVFYGKHTQRR